MARFLLPIPLGTRQETALDPKSADGRLPKHRQQCRQINGQCNHRQRIKKSGENDAGSNAQQGIPR